MCVVVLFYWIKSFGAPLKAPLIFETSTGASFFRSSMLSAACRGGQCLWVFLRIIWENVFVLFCILGIRLFLPLSLLSGRLRGA